MKVIYKCIVVGLFLTSLQVRAQAPGALSTKNKKAIELYMSADNYRVRFQYDQAIDLLKQAIEKDKEFVEAYLSLGVIYKSKQDLAHSSENLEKGLQLT